MAQNMQSVDGIIKTLEEWFAKAPALPKGGRDFIVNVAPWASLVVGVFFLVIGGFGLLGGAFLSPFAAVGGGVGFAANLLLAAVVVIVEGVIYLLAFKPLQARQMRGWKLLFWNELLMILHAVISLDWLGVIISFLLGFYFLFQIKSYYK